MNTSPRFDKVGDCDCDNNHEVQITFSWRQLLICWQISRSSQKYIQNVLDYIKMTCYKHLKIAIPETTSENKITVLGQYVSKLEKVIASLTAVAVFLSVVHCSYICLHE